jgi:threonine/homoserine/homoserine lactone efflux protein
MGDKHDDPSDHSRTTQPHAGIVMKDNFFWPALILFAVATFGIIAAVAAAAYGHHEWISSMVIIAVLGVIAGALWFLAEHRRVKLIDARRHATNPGRRL